MRTEYRDPYTTVVPVASRHLPEVMIYATGVQRYVYGQGQAVNAAKGRLLPFINAVARRLAADDDKFGEDLFQEAMLELVEVDPSRLERSDEDWLRRRLAATMERMAYKEHGWRDRNAGVDPDGQLEAGLKCRPRSE